MATATTYDNSSLIKDPTNDKITYVFLGSRKYPYSSDKTVKTDKDGQIESSETQILIALDVTTSLKSNWSADVSKYPITSGSEISDHLSVRNNTYTLEGIISDTPIEGHKNELFGSRGTGYERVMAAIDALETLYQAKKTFTFFSEHQKIENVVITKVSFSQEPQDAVAFSIDFEEIRFAYAKSVSLNVKKSAKKTVAANKNGGGASKQVAEDQANHRKTMEEARKINLEANK
jgi:hypothetical protein